jgi:hypothetical protein
MSLTRGGFQTFVNTHQAPGVVGAFASMNPRAVALAGPGAFLADSAAPVVVGYFAWGTISDGVAYGIQKANAQLGFVGNEGQTVITDFLGVSRLSVQAGFPVTLYTRGDFWAQVAGGAVAVGAAIYADVTTGEPTVVTTSFVGTGSIATTVLTITAVTSGALRVGDTVASSTITAGTKITALGTGTGGVGTYTVDTSQTAASATVSVAGVNTGFVAQTASPAAASSTAASLDAQGVLTVGATLTGTIVLGDGHSLVLNGTGVPANTFVISQLTGTTGSTGTYQTTSLGTVVASETMTFTTGTLVKISNPF